MGPELSAMPVESLWVYPALALVMALPLVPNAAVLATAGALAATGRLSVPLVLTAPFVGAVLGDLAVFAAGSLLASRARGRFVRRGAGPEVRTRITRHLRVYGTPGVIGVRFVPGGRFVGGLVAAPAGFTVGRFLGAACLAELVFVSYAVGLGYLGGAAGATGYAAVLVGLAVSALSALVMAVRQRGGTLGGGRRPGRFAGLSSRRLHRRRRALREGASERTIRPAGGPSR
ncbi:DedA family protein [Streptomyces sp. NPDC012600]|uniref:VTT domain-containing protein n=2 Tax=Streptomycetaceae TaxID=2062 RepID=A0ABU2VY78_9ACTN|nr:VTT domain-containing protein [Streptomyces griseus]ARF72261.1 hypothetical protein B7C62_08225 [Kitasatospora albolonga]MDT0490551.1 VTT domain-containing protein [Streptomyces griseus]